MRVITDSVATSRFHQPLTDAGAIDDIGSSYPGWIITDMWVITDIRVITDLWVITDM